MHTLPGDIHVIDTHYVQPTVAASYLVVHEGRAAFVETNTTLAVPRLLAALDAVDLPVSAVDYVIVTHVHLDHAGGAGALLRHLPEARLVVHGRGARHLVDPRRLWAGATAVYGEEAMATLYGEMVPVPEARVLVPEDGAVLDLAGRGLVCLDTPGHAKHHLAVLDERTRAVFTGDVFGLAYPALGTPAGPLLFPTTAPNQLDPKAMRRSVQRIVELEPSRLLLTHFGGVEDVGRAHEEHLRLLDAWQALALAAGELPEEERHAALVEGITRTLVERYRELGGALPEAAVLAWLRMDVDIDAQGWVHWLESGL